MLETIIGLIYILAIVVAAYHVGKNKTNKEYIDKIISLQDQLNVKSKEIVECK